MTRAFKKLAAKIENSPKASRTVVRGRTPVVDAASTAGRPSVALPVRRSDVKVDRSGP
jgi:hypothetical protein